MSKTFYKATHSNGTVHLRASSSARIYAFAVVGKKINDVSFSAKRPAGLGLYDLQCGRETVVAHAISSTEYAALDKANKCTYQVTFRGKKITKSFKGDGAQPIAAIGFFALVSEQRIDLGPDASDFAKSRSPEGFYMMRHPESCYIYWCTTQASLDEALSRKDKAAYREYTFEQLTITQL